MRPLQVGSTILTSLDFLSRTPLFIVSFAKRMLLYSRSLGAKMFGPLNVLLSSRRGLLYVVAIWQALLLYVILTQSKAGFWGNWGIFAIGPTILCVQLGSRYGSPLNWWVEGWGTTVWTEKRFRDSKQEFKPWCDEINEWLKTTRTRPYYQMNDFSYVFLRKRHAAMFKLAWG
jgi:hypothetical protein